MKLFPLAGWAAVAFPAVVVAQSGPVQDQFGHRPFVGDSPIARPPAAPGHAPRGGPQWRALGPFGGDVADVNISPTNPAIVLAGIAPTGSIGGTLYRSSDSGATWTTVPSLAGKSVYDVEFTAAGVVWVATDDSAWISTDDGQTFTERNFGIGLNDQTFAIEIDPSNPNVIWAGVADAIGSQTMNVLKSTDGGTVWTDVTPPGAGGVSASDIAINPADTNSVMVTFAGAFGGGSVYFTADGGVSWTAASAGLPTTPARAVRYSNGNWYVAGGQLFGSQFFGLWRSGDNGQNWTQLDDGTWPRAVANDVAIDPNNPNVIIAATVDGLHKSTDGGMTWTISSGNSDPFPLNSVRFAPGSSTRLAAGASSFGIILSDDAAATTRISSNGIGSLDVFSIAVNPLNADELAVAFQGQNNGGVYASTDNGVTWQIQSAPGTRYNAVAFNEDGTLYAISDGPIGLAQEGVYRRNADSSWTLLGPDQGALFESELLSIAFGETDPDLFITTGADFGVAGFEGTIWRSPDAGSMWTKVYENVAGEGAQGQKVLFVPGTNDQVVLVGMQSFSSAPIAGLFRSTDAGLTWTRITNGLPEGLWGFDLAISPDDPNTILLADGSFANQGVFISTDAGVSWAPYFSGYSVRGIAYDPTDASTTYFWNIFTTEAVHRSTNNGANIEPLVAGLAPGASPRQIIADDTGSPRILLATTVGAYVLELEEACLADFNNDGFTNSQDFFDFLVAFFALEPAADFNNDGFTNSQDFFDFLTAFFAGCP